jgi:hypothetical protein
MSRWLRCASCGNPACPPAPPPEAYHRVTDAGRFRPLHEEALALLEHLHNRFNVQRTEGDAVDAGLDAGQRLSRPTVRLVPADPAAAPIVVAFTSFPGLVIRCGRWHVARFPACGCDACGETAAGEAARLRDLVAQVTGGRFREAISLPLIGAAWYEYELGAPGQRRGRSRLPRARARQLIASGGRRHGWAPWR